MKTMAELATENEKQAKQKQKLIYSSHVLGFDLAYAFNIFFSTPLNFSQSPLHIAW
jgi:hypothetical protein